MILIHILLKFVPFFTSGYKSNCVDDVKHNRCFNKLSPSALLSIV